MKYYLVKPMPRSITKFGISQAHDYSTLQYPHLSSSSLLPLASATVL